MRQVNDSELEEIRQRAMSVFRSYGREHPGVSVLIMLGLEGQQAINHSIDRMSYFAGINDALSWLLGHDSPNLEHLASLSCQCGAHEGAAPNNDAVQHLNNCLKQSQS